MVGLHGWKGRAGGVLASEAFGEDGRAWVDTKSFE